MTVAIGTWPAQAVVRAPMPVQVITTGVATIVQVWLDDGSEAVLADPAGLTLTNAIVRLVPRSVGVHRLWARVFGWGGAGIAGCSWQTGVMRLVEIEP